MQRKGIGTIHPARSLFLRTGIGSARDGEKAWEISNLLNGRPIVRSETTGKWFTLSWEDVLDLARDAGIDEPEEYQLAEEDVCPKRTRG